MSSTNNLLYYRGRVALHAILLGLGLRKGERVATQAFTCLAVPEAIFAAGCVPTYIDTEKDGVNMCPQSLEEQLDDNISCVVVQHTFGIPAQIEKIRTICEQRSIPLIEDCCHVSDSSASGKALGDFGVAAFYSHEWGKPLPYGLGGSVNINDSMLESKLEEGYLQLHGPDWKKNLKQNIQFQVFSILYRPILFWPLRSAYRLAARSGVAESNYNPIETIENDPSEEFTMKMSVHAARRYLSRKEDLVAFVEHSQKISEIYSSRLNTANFSKVEVPHTSQTTYSRYPVWCLDKESALRKARELNLELAEWYSSPIHPLQGKSLEIVGYETGSCPNAERACAGIVSLPTHMKTSVNRAIKIANIFEL